MTDESKIEDHTQKTDQEQKITEDKPSSVFTRVITSRKGFVSFVVFVIGLIFTVGIVVSAIKGQITWDQAQNKIIAALAAFTVSATVAQNGWSKEDAAEKGKITITEDKL
jgi:hypothetical protein